MKIDGRADWFSSFGFRRLYSVLLVNEQDPAATIDVEMYDLGRSRQRPGAYGGERAPDVKPEIGRGRGLQHIARNALYMARGPYYLRVDRLRRVAAVIAEAARAGRHPGRRDEGRAASLGVWPLRGRPGPDPGNVSYFVENAFSFAFARDVWAARPKGKNDDLELFVVARADAAEARHWPRSCARVSWASAQAAGKEAACGPDRGSVPECLHRGDDAGSLGAGRARRRQPGACLPASWVRLGRLWRRRRRLLRIGRSRR